MCFRPMTEKSYAMRADTPFKAIACFDAVMRTGSIALAARQLFVTPGAVGQQIRKLESWLGTPLFRRAVRKLQPTACAISYWEQIRPALRMLDEASLVARSKPDFEVRVSLPPAFANSWFARRMPTLTSHYPELQLHLGASSDSVDLHNGTFDLAVRHFDGIAKDVQAQLLLPDEVRVYCSPDYRDRMQLHAVNDLPKATLLYTTSHAHWSGWLASIGLSLEGLGNGARFDQSGLAIDAARRSQGLVLTSPWLVEDDVEQGHLIQLFGAALKTGKGYYLVHAQEIVPGGAAEQFSRWLCDAAQCARDGLH